MGSDRIFNLVSILFVVLTVVIAVFVGLRLVSPPPTDTVDASLLPTAGVIPTITPTFTPSNTPTTLPPTFTYTPTDTPLPSATFTQTLTSAPTNTITPTPSPTPLISATPTITPSPTPSFTPTGPTPTLLPSVPPFLFDLREPPTFVANTFNSAGCAWQGVGGQVFGMDGNEITNGANFRVRVFSVSTQFDEVVAVGSNSQFGPLSGWEVQVSNVISTNFYFVQLETVNRTVISPRIEVRFPSDCNANVALVRFVQVRQP